MLEKIEESADQMLILKAAVAFYKTHLETQIVTCREQVKELPSSQGQLKELLRRGNQAELAIKELEEQRLSITKELEPLQPSLTTIRAIEGLEEAIREKEELVNQKQLAIEQELDSNPKAGEFVREEQNITAASLEHEKLILTREISRLNVDYRYLLRRLRESRVSRSEIVKLEKDIRTRVDAVVNVIEQKRETINTVSELIQQHRQAIEAAQPADVALIELQRDQIHLAAVTKIIGGVSLDAGALLESATEPVSTG